MRRILIGRRGLSGGSGVLPIIASLGKDEETSSGSLPPIASLLIKKKQGRHRLHGLKILKICEISAMLGVFAFLLSLESDWLSSIQADQKSKDNGRTALASFCCETPDFGEMGAFGV